MRRVVYVARTGRGDRRFGAIKRLLRVSRTGKEPGVRTGAHRRRASLAAGRRANREIRRHSLVAVLSDYFRFGHGDWRRNISR